MKPQIGSGDKGETSILGGRRVRKDSPIIEALGSIDEATAAIGVARAVARSAEVKNLLLSAQLMLENCAAEIAAGDGKRATDADFAAATKDLEAAMTRLAEGAPRPTTFIMPGSTQGDAALHLARAVTRRAERRIWALINTGARVPPAVPAYVNRLADLLFDLAYAESSD